MAEINRNITLFKRAIVLAVLILLSLLSLSIIVQIPVVQKFGVDHITEYLSGSLDTRVEVGKFGMNIFNHITLGEVFIEDPYEAGDTLFYTERLSVRFANPISLVTNKLRVRRVALSGLHLHISRPDGQPVSSLEYILEKIATDEKDTASTKLDLIVERVIAEDLDYIFDDGHLNRVSRYALKSADFVFDSLSLPHKSLSLIKVEFIEPRVSIEQLAPPDSIIVKDTSTVADSLAWTIALDEFTVDDGTFDMRKYGYEQFAYDRGINYKDISMSNIDFRICGFTYSADSLVTQVETFRLREKSGLEIDRARVDRILISDTGIAFTGISINTPASFFGDSIRLTYDSYDAFDDFENEVTIDGHFTDTRIAINDVLLAVPQLRNTPFFAQNSGQTLVLSGHVRGRINRLIGENIYGELGRLTFRGDFRSRNLAVEGEQMLNLRIQRADISASAIRQFLPDAQLPQQFNRLGRMVFRGNFDGFFYDFVAFGQLNSEIGTARMDMRLDVREGAALAEYSGAVELIDFDLGAWTDSEDFGILAFRAQVENGAGLTAEHAEADLSGVIYSLTFKGYTYQDITVDGKLDNRLFDGSLQIEDENVAFTFNGSVDMHSEVPQLDFNALIDTINLNALNLFEDTISLSGQIDIEGTISQDLVIEGVARASNFKISRSLDETYSIDTFEIQSRTVSDSLLRYDIVSDYINGFIEGEVAFKNAFAIISNHLANNYSAFFPGLRQDANVDTADVIMKYDLELRKAEEWLGVSGIRNIRFDTISIEGQIDLPRDHLSMSFWSPSLAIGTTSFDTVTADIFFNNGNIDGLIESDSVMLNNNKLRSLIASAEGDGYSLDWHIAADDILDTLVIDLHGTYERDNDSINTVKIISDRSSFFDNQWQLNPNNAISWKKGYIDINNFILRKEFNTIAIDDINNVGLTLNVDSFDLAIIDVLWDYEQLDFAGMYALQAQVDNIFNPKTIQANLLVEDLKINGDDYGKLTFNASIPEIGKPLAAQLNIDRPGAHLNAGAVYYLPFEGVDPKKQGSFTGEIVLDTFPMAFLEYWLGDAIESTKGYGIGSVSVEGDTSDAEMVGFIRVRKASTLVKVLGTRYNIDNQVVRLTSNRINLSGITITDEKGNSAAVSGGLTHELMANLGLDIGIQSPNIIGLNLENERGRAFYGYAEGAIRATFTGPVKRPVLDITATTGPGTRIYIPVAGSSVDADSRFIRFVSDTAINAQQAGSPTEITGLNLLMKLNVTPAAQVDIIFDERTREVLSGVGNGNIQLELTRTGEFTMFGDYEIESGDYLFRNYVINKPFVLRPGGTIRWSGDPYEAEINIRADYTGIRTSLYTLLQEYLVTASEVTQQEARRQTTVYLEMHLTGSLLTPTINFQISFPDVTGELRGYIDSKMSALSADQNALNEQVFGLLVLGTFLPSSNTTTTASSSYLRTGTVNTLTEFISSQFSYYVSEFVSSLVEDVDFISSIDVNVSYSQEARDEVVSTAQYDEWAVRVRSALSNDRIIVDVGGSYVSDNPVVQEGTYFAGDYALEYVLTQDRRLKIRVYYRTDYTVQGKQDKTGIGLAYRREFDTFAEWIKGTDKDAKKASKEARKSGEQR